MLLQTLTVLLLIVYEIDCDWIEIPQKNSDAFSKKSDYNLFILTTTSSTTQTPIFSKPLHNVEVIADNAETTMLTTESAKKSVLPRTTLRPGFRRNFTKGHVYKIDKPSPSSTEPTFSETEFQRRFSVDDSETISEEDFVDDTDSNYSYTSFIPFLSKVQGTLMKNARKSKGSKMSVLSNLHDHLLYQIQNRMSFLWKPKSEPREGRSHKDDSHVEFPSNEGALMTIGFLTFAVFLIKLVMQLINSVAATTPAPVVMGRKRREAVNEDVLRILRDIEQYTLK